MVDAGWYAQALAFTYWPKLEDNKVLYAFHMYEPFAYTSRSNFLRQKKKLPQYTYPGHIPYGGESSEWNKDHLNQWFTPFFTWAENQHIPASRLVAAEFGVYRKNPGAQSYLADLIDIFNEQNIHWAFYAFREDEWDGYDYEMGRRPLGWKYWQAIAKGEKPARPWNSENPVWQVIDQALVSETDSSAS